MLPANNKPALLLQLIDIVLVLSTTGQLTELFSNPADIIAIN
jgi:hypothetical protein